MDFTIDEKRLICLYDTSSRVGLVAQLRQALPHVDEADMAALVDSVAGQLERMTDAEFAALELDEVDMTLDDLEV